MLPIIDTHQHMWDLTRFSLPWLEGPGAEPLHKNHSQSEYREASAGTGIARTIYMEVDVTPNQRIAESVNHCLDSFGPDRVVCGGDWPGCNLGPSLGAWVAAARAIVSARPQEEQANFFAANAERLYGLV